MAFFKLRKGGDETAPAPSQTESIEVIRKRARHRLIGAAVLVLIGVIGFPLLFDTQPRPIDTDIPIEIPDRNKVKPLQAPVPAAVRSSSVAQPPEVSSAVAAAPARPQSAATPPQVKAEAKPEAKAQTQAEPKRVAKASEAKPAKSERREDGARAQALLEGKSAAGTPAAAEGRFIVQAGAFSDVAKARETRQKVEKAGLKTYTHIAEGRDGKLIRVRVGPFGTKAEAEKAAAKLKALDIKAAVLAL